MSSFMNIQTLNYFSLHLVSLMLMIFCKVSFLFTISYLIIPRLKLPARSKHYLWFLLICSSLFMFIFTALSPRLDLGLVNLPLKTFHNVGAQDVYAPQNFLQKEYIDVAVISEETGPLISKILIKAQLSWTFWVIFLWVGGIVIFLSRTIMGKIRLFCVLQRATRFNDLNCIRLIDNLSNRMGVKKRVNLLKSERCNIPFTLNSMHPVILLPQDIEKWPLKRIRSVLIHEMSHIKSKDYLTRFVSRTICLIFWFVPFLWIAYSSMQAEQEKACDVSVIDTGTVPYEYACHLVDIVRNRRGPIIFCGHNAMGNGNRLEGRIVNILNTKRGNPSINLKYFRCILIVTLLGLLPLFIIHPVSIQGYREKQNIGMLHRAHFNELTGTWANEEYNGHGHYHPAKLVINPDGTMEEYNKETSPEPHRTLFIITGRWSDPGGSISYKVEHIYPAYETYFDLCKISEFGSVLEASWINLEYPREINTEDKNYRIWYRLREDEEIYGTWINPDYKGAMIWDTTKIEFQPIFQAQSGKQVRYKTETSQFSSYESTYQIHEKWTDRKGDVWYKLTLEFKPFSSYWYILARISNSGKTIELCSDDHDYPSEIKSDSPLHDYYIYYREQSL